jgi:hypothetical protein
MTLCVWMGIAAGLAGRALVLSVVALWVDEVVTHVLGPFRYPCSSGRTWKDWRALQDSNLRPTD